MQFFYLILLIFICNNAPGQTRVQNWEKGLNKVLYEFLQCKKPIDDNSPCNIFVCNAIYTVYGVNDLYDEKTQRCRTANEIYDYLNTNNKQWIKMGMADNQKTLSEAQDYANQGYVVVAVYSNKPHGHIAIVLPGVLKSSSKWNLNVPNSASFFMNLPDNSYINLPLSYAFNNEMYKTTAIYRRLF